MEIITLQSNINNTIEKVWEYWTQSHHITQWNFAIPEWHCPKAVNNLKEEGNFSYRMEARDGSMGFDYAGTYTKIISKSRIEYALEDGREVSITFKKEGNITEVTQVFETEDSNPVKMQRQGWQAILDNFKKYVESN